MDLAKRGFIGPNKSLTDFFSLVIYGKAVYSTGKISKTPDTRLQVLLDVAVKENGLCYAKGDDNMEAVPYIGKGIFRVATIDNGTSLLHSVLKLISKDYVDEDTLKRQERCNRFIEKLDYNLSPENISSTTGYRLNIINGMTVRKVGEYMKNIFILENKDGTYEPLVKKLKSGEYCTVFE